MGKGVMGMDDGLPDLADLSQLMGFVMLDHLLFVQQQPALRICSILVSLSINIPPAE